MRNLFNLGCAVCAECVQHSALVVQRISRNHATRSQVAESRFRCVFSFSFAHTRL
jgi:hypothetical protein